MTSSIKHRATLSRRAGVKNRQIPLADFGFGQYSVQDSFMHHVAKWGISAGIFGGYWFRRQLESATIGKT